MGRFLKRLAADCRAAASSEFAVLAPVLLFLFVGSLEAVNLVRVERKLVNAAQTAANLATLEAEITPAGVADVFRAAELVMEPFAATPLTGAIASVRYDEDDGAAATDWQDGLRGGTLPEAADLAGGLGLPGESVVIVRLAYTYRPVLSGMMFGESQLVETAFARPRRAAFVSLN